MYVYKILSDTEWKEAKKHSLYEGTELDRKDGFVHLSTREQLAETLALYFSHQEGLVLLSFLVDDLENLKWEQSRNNQHFPHLYAKLPMQKYQGYWCLSLSLEGLPLLPW